MSAKEYQAARRLLNKLPPNPEGKYVFYQREWKPFTYSESTRRESCWTDEDGVQHWTVEDENGKREFTR